MTISEPVSPPAFHIDFITISHHEYLWSHETSTKAGQHWRAMDHTPALKNKNVEIVQRSLNTSPLLRSLWDIESTVVLCYFDHQKQRLPNLKSSKGSGLDVACDIVASVLHHPFGGLSEPSLICKNKDASRHSQRDPWQPVSPCHRNQCQCTSRMISTPFCVVSLPTNETLVMKNR